MTEWASTILALVIGGFLGLIMGVTISGDLTSVAYKVERLAPSVADACTHYPVSEATQ